MTDDHRDTDAEPAASRPGERPRKSGPVVFGIDVNPVDQAKVGIGPEAVGPTGPHPAVASAGEPAVWLRHNRIDLALHLLRAGDRPDAPKLLHLHGLGECTPAQAPVLLQGWSGEIWGLDFTGHGRSSVPRGGGYTAELLMADVDAALAHLGSATVIGRGLGAYVALLISGARPELVRGAVLLDGPGIVGGGIGPGSPRITLVPSRATTPDSYALAELSIDLRPPDYALTYLHQAVQFSDLDEPITLSGIVRPPWLAAVELEPGVRIATTDEALMRYSEMWRPSR